MGPGGGRQDPGFPNYVISLCSLKENPGVHPFSDQISKSGFSKIDQNSDKKKNTKTSECERI